MRARVEKWDILSTNPESLLPVLLVTLMCWVAVSEQSSPLLAHMSTRVLLNLAYPELALALRFLVETKVSLVSPGWLFRISVACARDPVLGWLSLDHHL